MRLGSDSFYVVRAPLVTSAIGNNTSMDWAHATQTLVVGASIQPFDLSPRISKEDNRDRSFQQTMYRVYAPADTDVVYTDRVLFAGVTYEVFGAPGNWRTLEGIGHHIEFVAVRRDG